MAIFLDTYGLPTNETLDGADSAMRAGVLTVFGKVTDINCDDYELTDGTLVRHPRQYPANNAKNFTRDQLMCLAGGLSPAVAKRVLWARLSAYCLAQNVERDKPGSVKLQRPHEFYADSNPTTETVPLTFDWNTKTFKGKLMGGTEVFVERRYFDGPDPLWPHHIGHLIVCAKYWPLYVLLPISWVFLLLAVAFNRSGEQNQLQVMVKRAGPPFVWAYKFFCPYWKELTRDYWVSRNEAEYSKLIIEGL